MFKSRRSFEKFVQRGKNAVRAEMENVDRNDHEIAESYLSSLVDLTNNSKPLINMLTMLAEENIAHGQTIINAIEQRIAKVSICSFQ